MGNLLTCQAPEVAGGMVMLSDGAVHELIQQTFVAELMLEHPNQFVVEARSLAAGNSAVAGRSKVTPLPADHMLDPRMVYVMIPMTRGKATGSAMLTEEARRILTKKTRSALRSRNSSGSIFRAEKDAASKSKGGGVMMKERGKKVGGGGGIVEWSTPAMAPVLEERQEILMRQYSSKGWKPSLGTIEERSSMQKVPHWLF